MSRRGWDNRRWLTLAVIACFVAAIGGVLIGRVLFPAPPQPGAELHDVLHHQLSLDSGQQARLHRLEQQFAMQRRALELELRADNARLAEAMEAEHGNGPRVTAAVTQIASLSSSLNMFEVDNSYYPKGKDGLRALLEKPSDATNWRGPYLDDKVGLPNDPWGNPYSYEYPSRHGTSSYDLSSAGPDGKMGTEDDINNWAGKK